MLVVQESEREGGNVEGAASASVLELLRALGILQYSNLLGGRQQLHPCRCPSRWSTLPVQDAGRNGFFSVFRSCFPPVFVSI